MKTAEEWLVMAAKSALRVPSNDAWKEVDESNFLFFVKQIQLDAIKQGMTEAAELVEAYEKIEVPSIVASKILHARDSKEKV